MRQAAMVAFPFVIGLLGLALAVAGADVRGGQGLVATIGGVGVAVFMFTAAIDNAAALVLDRLADMVDIVLELTGEDRDDA